MPCYHPITIAHKEPVLSLNPDYTVYRKFGNRSYQKNVLETRNYTVPCGRCIGCVKRHATDWTTRICNETTLHSDNCILHLTYDYKHLPEDDSVNIRHLQLFFKRLRKSLPHTKIRYFAAAEYGEKKLRPHYHVIVFGWKPADLEIAEITKKGSPLYSSSHVSNVWQQGRVRVGDVSIQSAAYVARYSLKKRFEASVPGRAREFHTMSRRPGIGFGYYAQYLKNVYSDKIPIPRPDGSFAYNPVPRYYFNLLKLRDPLVHDIVSLQRFETSCKYTPDELSQQEAYQFEMLKGSSRQYLPDPKIASSPRVQRLTLPHQFCKLPKSVGQKAAASYFYHLCRVFPCVKDSVPYYVGLDPSDLPTILGE